MLVAALLAAAAAAEAPAPAAWTPCLEDKVEGRAECTMVEVPEDRARPDGRRIGIRVARLLPLGPDAAADPVVVLQGGPGQSAISLADFYGGESWRETRRRRAILLVDQRGTGGSNPLACELGGSSEHPEGYFYEMQPEGPLTLCREALAARADLSRYTTEDAVADLEAVRRRIGYRQVDLYGASYGVRVALRYLDRYPESVRSLALKGVVPPSGVIPESFARDTERSLNLLLGDCAANTACRAAYPTLREDLRRLRDTLAKGPVTATIDAADGSRRSVTLTEGMVASSIRSALQGTPTAAQLPRLISAAGRGDYAPMAGLVLLLRKAAAGLYAGMSLSVICAEDAPYLPPARPDGTLLGGYWRDRVIAGCRVWNVPRAPAEFRRPKSHPTPALLISGETDPATPPAGAEEVRRLLPNSAHLVAAKGSHSFAGMRGCADRLIAELYERADPKRLDLSCGAGIARPPFAPPSEPKG